MKPHMTSIRSTARRLVRFALATSIGLPLAGLAQAPAAPSTATPSSPNVQLLFVQNGTGMEYDQAKGTLTLKGISNSTIFFADRPVRLAGQYETRAFLELWDEGPDSFAKNPPNATLAVLEAGKPGLQDVVVTLRKPRMKGGDLIYDVKVIEGTLPRTAGTAALFIDWFGFWRRRVAAVAVVGTAAVVTTAAVASSNAAAANAASANSAANAAAANSAATSAEAAKAAASSAASSAATSAAAANAAAAKAQPGPQSAAEKKLEQLKALEREGLITAAQYQKASQQVLDEIVK